MVMADILLEVATRFSNTICTRKDLDSRSSALSSQYQANREWIHGSCLGSAEEARPNVISFILSLDLFDAKALLSAVQTRYAHASLHIARTSIQPV